LQVAEFVIDGADVVEQRGGVAAGIGVAGLRQQALAVVVAQLDQRLACRQVLFRQLGQALRM